METVRLHFCGPLTFLPGDRCLFRSPLAKAPCVYLWTVRSDLDGRDYIHYVGEASSFASRQREHLIHVLGLDYGIFDPAEARRGVLRTIWPGLWRETTPEGPARQIAIYEAMAPEVIRYVQCLRVFAAGTSVPTPLRKHIEGSIARNLRANHPEAKVLYPDDNRVGRMRTPASLVLHLSAEREIAGLDEELEI